MSRPKLAVCGASWFCSDPRFPDKSFPEILCQQHNWDLLTLARGGCSNLAIALQIEHAISVSADYILVQTVGPDRIEIPIVNTAQATTVWDKMRQAFNWHGWFDNQPHLYQRSRGIANIQYHPHPDVSSKNEFLTEPTTISESMNNLAFDGPNSGCYRMTEQQKSALKYYMSSLYDAKFKQQVDCWAISNACHALAQSKIPFLVFTSPLFDHEFEQDIAWLDSKHQVTKSDFDYEALPKAQQSAPRFHYQVDSANIIADYINQRWF